MERGNDHEWFFEDVFGRKWHFWLVPVEQRASTARDSASPGGNIPVRQLVFFAFDDAGPRIKEAADALLSIHDALTGRDLSRELRRASADGGGGPRSLRRVLEDALRDAIDFGALRFEEVTLPRFAFPEDVQALPTVPNVAPTDTASFVVRVVDEAGEAIDGIDMVLDGDGDRRTVTTDSAGIARFTGVTASRGSARVSSIATVREKLTPRWKAARQEKLPDEGDDVTIQALRHEVFSFAIDADTLHTLAIVPNHERVRLVGMHFDTNKCFLLPSAMAGIRIIKLMYDEADTTQFLVVGHTDKTGPAAYNATLSLERAQAIADFLKNNVDGWNQFFKASRPEKRWGGREVNAMLSVLPERQKPFASGGTSHAADPKAVKAFQSFSNDTRGTSLPVNGVADDDTRREIVTAYMALQDTTLPDGATITAHGCGPNQPLPDDENGAPRPNADQRRVDIFAFEGPVRPPPPGPTSGPGAPEYDQWVGQMKATRDVGTDVLTFNYAVDTGDALQWSEAATISLVSEDAVDAQSFVLSHGEKAGSLRIFTFVGIRPGVRYRADINEGPLNVALFDFTALHGVASETSPDDQLAMPAADPAAPFSPVEDAEDFGTLRVKLFGDGNALASSLFRFNLGGTSVGYSEDGVASAPLPPACPVSCTLEWGEPGDDGTLPYRVELALDCGTNQVGVSSMLHNLGYPRNLPMETRVRSFQDANEVGEHGLTPSGDIPPATHAAIVKIYNSQLA